KSVPYSPMTIQDVPIKLANGTYLGKRIAIKRTIICGWPKYPSPQAAADIIAINETPETIFKLLGSISPTASMDAPQPPILEIATIGIMTKAKNIKEP